jgi:O-acetyl-ADP-ribose deacetylase (regulator of RNase III)
MLNRIEAINGDITTLEVDVIVNAANERMLGGGGVDHAIHAAAGPELLEACKMFPEVRPDVRCPTGEARITAGFKLPAKYVVHTVGPIWKGGSNREPELLASAYLESLKLAASYKSIAFPSISAGAYGYPAAHACEVAVRTIKDFLKTNTSLEKVYLVSYNSPVILELLTRMIQVI